MIHSPRPQVADAAGEAQARVNEPATQAVTVTVRVHQQDSQSRSSRRPSRWRRRRKRTGTPSVNLGDPGRLARGVVGDSVVRDDLGDQRLERGVRIQA